MFFALIAVVAVLALAIGRQPRGPMRALAAGIAVLALCSAAMVRLRAGNLPGHRPRRWRSAS
ncbi:hypothetical protein GXW78_18590 [Roseomonas terrae]|uniref:Uncharacterized protein n=1 Tax=Neoroseomonas terrae TaxID=424799 RepID=A0ABS5EKX5_9PROT|nr:hypothetical protein [Neoroseomonas terrae]MBR0651684.1 hypothetical protein [Neoroseomonas terrae]